MADKILDDGLDALLYSKLNEINERNSVEYDGVLGVLPEWIPEWRMQEFQEARSRLLEKFTHSQILQWLDSHNANCMAAKDCDYIRLEFIPLELKNDISCLALIRNAVLLGKKGGLGQLAGALAAKGDDFSQGGSSKKGKYYEPKASIEIICDEIKSFVYKDVLSFLMDAEQCKDIYESTIKPTGVLFSGVNPDAGIISYIKRGRNPNEPKSLAFERFGNILSELKKIN